MEFVQSNYFKLEEPHEWVCQLRQYRTGHSEMEIEIRHQRTKETQYIGFAGVDYFEGPVQWQGANFELGSAKDCLAFIRRTNDSDQLLDDFLLESTKLFSASVVNSDIPQLRVNIVAAVGVLTDRSNYL